jgi:xanthine dehydrogenase accessory factor
VVTYGVTKEEAARFGLPCGGTLRLVQEPLQSTRRGSTTCWRAPPPRAGGARARPATGAVRLEPGARGEAFAFDGRACAHCSARAGGC